MERPRKLIVLSTSTYLRSRSRQRSPAGSGLPSTSASRAYSAEDSVRRVQKARCVGTNHSRKPGQGGDAETQPRDLRAELLAAEAAHQAKKSGLQVGETSGVSPASKHQLQLEQGQHGPEDEDPDAKRRRVLEETRDIDADSDGAASDSSEEESDEEDETAELMRELEKIKRERAEEKAKEVRMMIHAHLSPI